MSAMTPDEKDARSFKRGRLIAVMQVEFDRLGLNPHCLRQMAACQRNEESKRQFKLRARQAREGLRLAKQILGQVHQELQLRQGNFTFPDSCECEFCGV